MYSLIGGNTLQCCVGFCRTTMQFSRNYTYITSLLSLPPSRHITPPGSSQSMKQGSLCYTATSHQLSALHTVVYICRCYFLYLSHSLLPPLYLHLLDFKFQFLWSLRLGHLCCGMCHPKRMECDLHCYILTQGSAFPLKTRTWEKGLLHCTDYS